MSKIAKEATVGLVDLAFSAVNTLCNQHGKALSKAYSNFDRVVGLGWLVADALGAPLLSKEAAYTIGIKLRKLPGALKADQAAARKEATRAASKLAPEDPQRQQLKRKAAEEEARLARVVVDVELPSAAPAAPARPSGSRMIAKQTAEPSLEERADAAELAVLAAKKALDRAGTAENAADQRFSAISAQFDHISKRAETHFARKFVPRKKPQCCIQWHRHVQKAAEALDNAMLTCKDAQISALQKHIEWRDALDVHQELEQELFHEQNDHYIGVLECAAGISDKR